MRRGFLVVILVAAVAVAGFAPPALGEDTFIRWTPNGVLSGQWSGVSPDPVEPLTVGTTECKGQQRAWRNGPSAVLLRLTWFDCHGGMDPVAADLDDRRGGRYADVGVPSALGAGLDLVERAGSANQRTWVEGHYRVTVFADCPGAAAATCTGLTAAAARDLSARLPGEPVETRGSRSLAATGWIVAMALFWLLGIGAAAGLRRLRRDSYRVAAGMRRWVLVDAAARVARRKARLRRVAVLLGAPLLFAVLVTIARSASGTVDANAVALLALFGILLGVPATVLLVLSRGAPRPDDWRWQIRRTDLPHGRRVAATLLDIGSGLTLVALVVLFLAGMGSGRTVSLPPELTALTQMMFFGLLALAWPVSRWVRNRMAADVWSLLNARPGEPILYVRGLGGAGATLRAAPRGGRGPLHYAARLLVASRKQPFEEVLIGLLARHGRVVAVQPDGSSGSPGPASPTTYSLAGGRPALAQAVRDAHLVALLVGAYPQAQALARDVVELCVDRPLLLVLPPGPPAEVAVRWQGWWRCVAEIPPMSALHPSFAPDGTHVLVHLPGDGWYAWGAAHRDEYTYAAAVHDGLARATAGVQSARRVGDVPGVRGAAHSVEILATAADQEAARDMAGQLAGMDVTAVVADPVAIASDRSPAGDVVVVISPAALADLTWVVAVGHMLSGPVRPVPVVRGTVRAEDLPPGLAGRNWLHWGAGPRAMESAALYAAVNSDPERYEVHRDLLTRATAWVADNRSDTLLITGEGESEAAVAHLIAAEQDSLAQPSPLIRDFVAASAVAARRRRRQRGRWLVGGTALLIVTALLVSVGWWVNRGPAGNSRLAALVGLTSALAADRPDWIGVLAGALILQGNERQAATARATLRATLDATWPHNFIGAAHDAPITDMAMVGGTDLLTADGMGSVTRWDPADGSVRWRRQVARPLTRLAATPDGGHAVAVSPGALHLLTTDPWRDRTVPVDGEVIEVAITDDGRTASYATRDGQLGVLDVPAGNQVRRPARYPAVLDLRPDSAAGSLRALVRTGPRAVAVVDAVSGRVTARAAAAGAEYGSVGAGGYLAVGAGDGELAAGPAGSGLSPVGVKLPRAVYDVDVLPHGRIITASPAYGLLAIQAPDGLVTARLQVAQHGEHLVRVSPDGRFLLCTNGLGVTVWRTDELWPAVSAPKVAAPGSTPRATAAGLVVEGGPDGVVTVRGVGDVSRYPAVTGRVTAAAISADQATVVVGSSLGEAAEVDLTAGTVVRRWISPTGGTVRTVGWDSGGRLAIRTTSWWGVDSCAGCGADGPLLAALRARVRGCYAPANLDGISRDTRQRLGLRECHRSPGAE